MNTRQLAALKRIREYVYNHYMHSDSTRYEFKQFDIHDIKLSNGTVASIFVVVCAGLIGDENNVAYMARDRRLILVGKRGGMKLLNPARGWSKKVYGRRALYALTR